MKKLLLALMAFSGAMACFAQDSTSTQQTDTIRVGGMIIIKKKGKDENGKKEKDVIISNHRRSASSNISTNWWIVDLGFANLNDQTNYASAEAQAFAPGTGKDQFKLKAGKSVNVNLWFFMQKLNL